LDSQEELVSHAVSFEKSNSNSVTLEEKSRSVSSSNSQKKMKKVHHVFHEGCLREWIESGGPKSDTCPKCRNIVKSDELDEQRHLKDAHKIVNVFIKGLYVFTAVAVVSFELDKPSESLSDTFYCVAKSLILSFGIMKLFSS